MNVRIGLKLASKIGEITAKAVKYGKIHCQNRSFCNKLPLEQYKLIEYPVSTILSAIIYCYKSKN